MGGKGGADIYQSDYREPVDTLGFETALGILSGQGINSPTLASSRVAQEMGGEIQDDGSVKFPDGTVLNYNPSTQSYEQTSGGNVDYSGYYRTNPSETFRGYKTHPSQQQGQGFSSLADLQSYVAQGGKVYDASGKVVDVPIGTGGDYAGRANEVYQQYAQTQLPTNDLFKSYQKQVYNPETGQYEAAATSSAQPQAMGSDYYLGKYGGFLDQPTQSLAPVSDSVRASIYQKGADRISSSFRDAQAENEKFIARQGGNLSSGRQAGLRRDITMEKNRNLQDLGQTVDTEAALRDYEDAKYRREVDRENQMNKFKSAEALDAGQRDRAFAELQADRQQKLSAQSALSDLMRIYAGQDATAASYAAAQANAAGSALGSIFGAGAKIAGA